ncbi:MAG: acyl-CoA dehydrogenase [Chromatiales bacterium]|jgi:alkylation response protein AidB-like acyl-CoA dehydrogenase|nr:acyl-CoA dehydrogenase [Chromatiales bacterium]
MSSTEQPMDAFRASVRDWLEANCPASMRTPAPDDEIAWGGRNPTYKNPDSKVWLDRMAAKGWTAPTWPTKYSGGGLSLEQNRALQEEMSRIGARSPLQSFGLMMLGPALLEFATEEQKSRFLPEIVRGEIRWCQGYSEPGSGSDLASLRTRAENKGDHYLVNGSKIWTSYANFADWIFCLVRTDPDAPKHRGISFLLFDMTTDGVATKPIQLISGASPFCQTFFDDVRVPKEQLVGELNNGWTIAKRLLQHERASIATMGRRGANAMAPPLPEISKRYVGEHNGGISDPVIRDRVAEHTMDAHAFALTTSRAAEEAKAGMADGAASSMFKYYGTELNKRKFELMLESMGTQSLGWEGSAFEANELGTTRSWLRSKANSIEGGTSEVQLNIIAKRVLGLPD